MKAKLPSEVCWWDWSNSHTKNGGARDSPCPCHPTHSCIFISHQLFKQVTPGQHIYAIQDIHFPH